MDVPEIFMEIATPEASVSRLNGFGKHCGFGLAQEDSGYLSAAATPDSEVFQCNKPEIKLGRDKQVIPTSTPISLDGGNTSMRENLAYSGLHTPDIMNAASKKRFTKCAFKKYKSFPISAFDCPDEVNQPKHDGWPAEDDSFSMAVDLNDDPNRDNLSMYEIRNSVNEDSMDVGDFPDSLELAAEDELYNDRVIEKVHSINKSIGVNTEDGMQLLHTKLTAVQLATQQKPERPLPTWRNHYNHIGFAKIGEDLCGKRKVDFFSLLAVESEHTHIVGKILGYLSAQDLSAVAKTCDDYTTMIKTNAAAKSRLNDYLSEQAQEKENLQQAKPRPVHSGNVALSEIANVIGATTSTKPDRSPPITPTKRRFQSFVRAAQNVKPGDQLTQCPHCRRPATVDSDTHAGKCNGQFCGYEFCAYCRRPLHSNSPCLVLESPQAKRVRMMVPIGSKKSKRNLQRL